MSERDQRLHSLRIIDEYTWMLLRLLDVHVGRRLGEAGRRALAEGFRNYGFYRGQSLYDAPRIGAEGRDAMSLLRAWDHGDLMLAQADGRLCVEGGPRRSVVRLDRVPGAAYLAAHGADLGILASYWSETLKGLAAGFDDDLSVSHAPVPADPAAPWSITFDYAGKSSGRSDAPPADAFEDAERAIRLSRRTMGVLGTLTLHVSKALAARFDASGEEVLRETLYEFGAERGRAIREQALKEGLPLDFQSWTTILQRRDPNASAFVFRGGTVSPGVFSVVCTHCPVAEVWSEEGASGLAHGYVYDVAVHRGLVEGFHPKGTVAWEQVKTRGDKICNFHFLIPELVTKRDPDWAQKAAGLM